MKVFAEFTENMVKSRAVDRIVAALKRYAPKTIEFVNSKNDADLVVLQAYGRKEHLKIEIDRLMGMGKKYAIIQLCIKSTRNPEAIDWLPIWKDAKLVWSYYDLPALCKEEGFSPNFKFYHAPLGLDDAFKNPPPSSKKEYLLASSGLGFLTESVRECYYAAQAVGGKVFHVGPVVTEKPGVDFSNEMSDTELAKKYAACKFVSGLRRREGFEFPVIEGLMCGARPVVFDRPDNHHWFDGLAVFIPETSRDGIIENLAKVLRKGAKPVTKEEIEEAKKRFDWKPIIEGFWKKCIA
jgi:hypothetical protein